MITLTVYALACFGLSFVLAYAKITLPLRDMLDRIAKRNDDLPNPLGTPARWVLAWVECVACTGWWIGLGTGLVGYVRGLVSVPELVALPFFSLAVNFLLGRWTRLID